MANGRRKELNANSPFASHRSFLAAAGGLVAATGAARVAGAAPGAATEPFHGMHQGRYRRPAANPHLARLSQLDDDLMIPVAARGVTSRSNRLSDAVGLAGGRKSGFDLQVSQHALERFLVGVMILPGAEVANMATGAPLILLVEDEPDLRELITDFVEAAGLRLEAASNYDDGVVLLNASQPALVIANVFLPGGDDGPKLAEVARRLGVPTLLISGRPEVISEGDTRGAAFLAKPFRLDEFQRAALS